MLRLRDRAPSLLGQRWLPLATVALAVLLVSPSLRNGWFGDDNMLRARIDPRGAVPGFPYAPLDLFTFVSGDPVQRATFREIGLYPWWMAGDFRMAFWRPLSSLTHLLDEWLRPASAGFAHAQSLLWFAALLGVLAALYPRFHTPWVANLALVLYALDDARAWPVGWVANRNALVAATLAFAALLAHDRARRDGWRPGRWLAPLLFGTALLGGESALAVGGYLLAHALFLDSGSLGRRLGRLWPYAALSLLWLLAYRALGYGTGGGGMYLNPMDEPALYLRALLQRLPVLLAAQVGAGLSDVFLLVRPTLQLVLYVLALVVLAVFAVLLAPTWRRLPACRFWTVGAVLSLPPTCATYPMDRLLVFSSVGAMATIALVFADWVERRQSEALPRRLVTAGVAMLALFHLALAPLLLAGNVLTLGLLGRMTARLDDSIPSDPSVGGQTLIMLSNPVELTALNIYLRRELAGVPHPRRMRHLVACLAPLHVSRVDERTLRVRPERGVFDQEFMRITRGTSRPFHAGDEVVLSDMRARVRAVTEDGRPAEVDFTFALPLEDRSLLWRRLHAGGLLTPWSPPPVGETVVLPPVAPQSAPPTADASHPVAHARP